MATATSGVLVYWDASFSNATIPGCEGMTPKTYTTQMRTFTVVSPPPATMPITPTITPATPPTASGSVSLAGAVIALQGNGMALVKLNCLGIASCHGKLTVAAKDTVKGKDAKDKKARSVSIGTTDFAISGDEATTVKMNLNAAGRALLKADHGRCSASLALLEFAPSSTNTQTKTVHLIQQKIAKGKNR
jgi:hypothetical protein